MCEYEYLECLNTDDLTISPSSLNSSAAEKKVSLSHPKGGHETTPTDPWGDARNGTAETLSHFLTGASIRKM